MRLREPRAPWCARWNAIRSLLDRVERLMTIPAVGPITALTWALEVGDVKRFSSIKKAISYCGLCGAEKSSGEHDAADASVQTAQQTFADDVDRGGQDGATQQPGAGPALRSGKAERQCQSRDAGGGTEARGLPDGRGPRGKRIFMVDRDKHCTAA